MNKIVALEAIIRRIIISIANIIKNNIELKMVQKDINLFQNILEQEYRAANISSKVSLEIIGNEQAKEAVENYLEEHGKPTSTFDEDLIKVEISKCYAITEKMLKLERPTNAELEQCIAHLQGVAAGLHIKISTH
jgi:hypothetical protein